MAEPFSLPISGNRLIAILLRITDRHFINDKGTRYEHVIDKYERARVLYGRVRIRLRAFAR